MFIDGGSSVDLDAIVDADEDAEVVIADDVDDGNDGIVKAEIIPLEMNNIWAVTRMTHTLGAKMVMIL